MIHKELSLQQLLEHISPASSHEEWALAICRVASQLTESSLTALYKVPRNANKLTLQAKIGHTEVPKSISTQSEFFQATAWCDGAVVQNSATGPFQDLLLNEKMQSGLAVLLESVPAGISEGTATHQSSKQEAFTGLLVANYSAPYHYTGSTIALFEQVRTLISYAPQGNERAKVKEGATPGTLEKTSEKTKGSRGTGGKPGGKAGGKQ